MRFPYDLFGATISTAGSELDEDKICEYIMNRTKLRDISSHQVVGGGLSSGALKNPRSRHFYLRPTGRLISRVIARNLPPLSAHFFSPNKCRRPQNSSTLRKDSSTSTNCTTNGRKNKDSLSWRTSRKKGGKPIDSLSSKTTAVARQKEGKGGGRNRAEETSDEITLKACNVGASLSPLSPPLDSYKAGD